jgi:hypothetical protein
VTEKKITKQWNYSAEYIYKPDYMSASCSEMKTKLLKMLMNLKKHQENKAKMNTSLLN